jgi:hypothetical protein
VYVAGRMALVEIIRCVPAANKGFNVASEMSDAKVRNDMAI